MRKHSNRINNKFWKGTNRNGEQLCQYSLGEEMKNEFYIDNYNIS